MFFAILRLLNIACVNRPIGYSGARALRVQCAGPDIEGRTTAGLNLNLELYMRDAIWTFYWTPVNGTTRTSIISDAQIKVIDLSPQYSLRTR